LKGSFFCAFIFLLVGTTQVVPSGAVASSPEPRKVWVPKSKHADARILVDPGPQGLLGQYKLLTLKLPEFIASYQGPTGKLTVRVHPPHAENKTKASWTGKRVGLTMLATTLPRKELEKAMAALITIVQKREERWGWLWRPVAKKKPTRDAFSKVYRKLAYGENTGIEEVLRALEEEQSTELVTLLDGVELSYRAGKKDFALVFGGKLARAAEKKLVQGDKTSRVLKANSLLLSRAFALAGRMDQLKRVEGGILGSPSACKATAVAKALDAAGRKTEASEFVEEQILRRTSGCASALDLAVTFRLSNDDLEGAKTILKAHIGSLTNQPASYLARARVKFAAGEIDQGIDLLRTALRFNPKEPAVYDLLATALLLDRKNVASLTQAKKSREEKLKQMADQFYAGVLCAAYNDSFCVGAATRSAKSILGDEPALPIRILETLDAFVAEKSEDLSVRLDALWEKTPHLLLPLLIEKLGKGLSPKPNLDVLSRHTTRVYGPGFGRQVRLLAQKFDAVAPEASIKEANPKTSEAQVVEHSDAADTEDTEFPLPPWLLLTLGSMLAFIGIVGAIKQRREHTSSKNVE